MSIAARSGAQLWPRLRTLRAQFDSPHTAVGKARSGLGEIELPFLGTKRMMASLGTPPSDEPDRELLARLDALAVGPTPKNVTLETSRELATFLALPKEQRAQFNPWFGHALPLWDGDCLRCDSPLDCANDSYGTGTYTRLYRCRACGWRSEQETNAPTMSSLYEGLHAHKELEKRLAVTDQAALAPMPELTVERVAAVSNAPDDIAARRRFADWAEGQGRADLASAIRRACETLLPTHWDEPKQRFENAKWYGPVVELLGDVRPHITSLQMRAGFVDFVAMDARSFLECGEELFAHAPIRCVTLQNANGYLDRVLNSALTQRLVGLGLDSAVVTPLSHAPALPRLRHLAIHSRHEHTIEEMQQLATARSLEALSCLHLRTPPLTASNDDDYMTTYSWSEYGLALQSLAARANRRWLDEIVRAAEKRIRRG